jgi:hypothetical protein
VNDIGIGTPITFSHGMIRRQGVVTEVYGTNAVILINGTLDDTVSLPLAGLTKWEPPYPPFEAGYGRPDLDMLYQVAQALRFQTAPPSEVLANVETYLTNRRDDRKES